MKENTNEETNGCSTFSIIIGMIAVVAATILVIILGIKLYWVFSDNKQVYVEPIGEDFTSIKIVNKTTGEDVEAYSNNWLGLGYYSFSITESKNENKNCLTLDVYGRKSDSPKTKCFNNESSSGLSLNELQTALVPKRVFNFTTIYNSDLNCRLYVLNEGNKMRFPSVAFHCENKKYK